MPHIRLAITIWLAFTFALVAEVSAQAEPDHAPATPSASDLRQRCEALSHGYWGITDAPTEIATTGIVSSLSELTHNPRRKKWVELAEKHIGAIQPYCRVTGYVAPSVGFQLLLPVMNWNRKFLHLGCGGWCGTTEGVLECVLHPGYACMASDMGHTGRAAVFLRGNLQGQIDFSYRATHVATLAGKAITEWYYAMRPQKSYFMGGSTGGYQGMVEAQRYPWDFDGIVVGAPDMDESDLSVHDLWMLRNFMGSDGKPLLSPDDLQLVHRAALAKCDMDDGVQDGIISDPVHCKFDPGELLCKTVESSKCLSAKQVQAVKNIYGAPVTSSGVPLTSHGVFPGSEIGWSESFHPTMFGEEFFRDTAFLGEDWKPSDFDFDRDYPRSGSGVLFPDTNPDLRKFKAGGGKLLVYQGATDTEEYPPALLDYYDTVERTMGGRAATQDFFRLFLIPGMKHVSGGDGAYAIDYLSYMEAWVEQGKPPDVMMGAHPTDEDVVDVLKFPLDPSIHIGFTRPFYPYPLYARYKGTGDPNKAENFRPVSPGVTQ